MVTDPQWLGARNTGAEQDKLTSGEGGKSPAASPGDEYTDRLASIRRNKGSYMGSQNAEVSG